MRNDRDARPVCGLAAILAAATLLLTTPLLTMAQPVPAFGSAEWELKFDFQQPQRIQLKLAGDESAKTYWYMLYRVTNLSGDDRDFLPVIDRVSEVETELPEVQVETKPEQAPQILIDASMTGLDPAIFKAIAKRHAKTHPFMVSPVEAIGRIRHGRDYAVDSVAVFADLDPRVSKFTIYVGGLSGEHSQQPNPNFRAEKPESAENPRGFVLQKTLGIPYILPGDVRTRRLAEPALGRLFWVMR